MTGPALATRRVFACRLEDLRPDEGLKVDVPDHPGLAVFLSGGEVYAIDDRCTHGMASLSEGYCENGEVECPFHQGCFDLRTGRATRAPCVMPVKTYRVAIVGRDVYVELDGQSHGGV